MILDEKRGVLCRQADGVQVADIRFLLYALRGRNIDGSRPRAWSWPSWLIRQLFSCQRRLRKLKVTMEMVDLQIQVPPDLLLEMSAVANDAQLSVEDLASLWLAGMMLQFKKDMAECGGMLRDD